MSEGVDKQTMSKPDSVDSSGASDCSTTSPFDHLVGRLCITPYDETAGLMVVEAVYFHDEWMARGVFVGKHPHGYDDNSPACYHASGLRPTVLVVFGDDRFGREDSTALWP